MDHGTGIVQTKTPFHISAKPQKQELVDEYKGKPLNALRTPALVIDRAKFAQNCAAMHEHAKAWGASFRAHVKSHKTVEGTSLQLSSSAGQTHAIVVSTVMEACEVIRDGLTADGTVKDILYGLPIAVNKIKDLSALCDQVSVNGVSLRILIDHPAQIAYLEQFESKRDSPRKWSVFIKIDCGTKRAGLRPDSPQLREVLRAAFNSPAVSVYGFYSHGGHAYASTSLSEASDFLSEELESVNSAAGVALSILKSSPKLRAPSEPFVLAVGSTPTAHAATAETRAKLKAELNGTLELHAGCYPLLDLQQLHTGMIHSEDIAQRVLATVISLYPGRGEDGTDEALCDAGALALSKDVGPFPGYGEVVGKAWRLAKISQEHGVLRQTHPPYPIGSSGADTSLHIGDTIQIIGQHACLILASFPWYYVVDSSVPGGANIVEDVWVPWKGW